MPKLLDQSDVLVNCTQVVSFKSTVFVRVSGTLHQRGLMKRTHTVILRRPRP